MGEMTTVTRQVNDRVRHIFIPFVFVALAFFVAYALFDYALIQKGILRIDDEVVAFWIPFIAAWIPALIWIRPRLKALHFKRDRSREGFIAIAAIAMAIPAIIMHTYIQTASGVLTNVATAEQIGAAADTRYYAVPQPCIDKQREHAFNDFEERGRNAARVDMGVYVVAPLCHSVSVNGASKNVWIGRVFHETVDAGEVEGATKVFFEKSLTAFERDEQVVSYLEQPVVGRDRRGLEAAIAGVPGSGGAAAARLLISHTDAFEARNGRSLEWTFATFALGCVVFLIAILVPAVDEQKMDALRAGAPRERFDFARSDLSAFIPRRADWGLPLLLDTNILVFVVMVFAGLGVASFSTRDLIAWGAVYRPELHGVGILRIFSGQFVHGGVVHLINNLVGLLVAGTLLRPLIGNTQLVTTYLIGGACAALASAWYHPDTASVGASGAILGLFGILLSFVITYDPEVAEIRSAVWYVVAIYGGLSLLIGFFTHHTDNAAHLGGLIAGLLMGLVLRFSPGLRSATRPESAAHES
jgi:rhomboid protease GluP